MMRALHQRGSALQPSASTAAAAASHRANCATAPHVRLPVPGRRAGGPFRCQQQRAGAACIPAGFSHRRRQQQRRSTRVAGTPEAAAAAAEATATSSAAAADDTVEEPPGFAELGVDPLLVAGLAEGGITSPSPIQESAIPALLGGTNAAIQSYTGSGKTLAYLLPALTLALQRAEAAYRRRTAAATASAAAGGGRRGSREADQWTVQALVVAPSQELAMQICRVAQSLLPRDSRTAVQQAIGGANLRRQADAIVDHQPLLVVGTPGRIVDLIGVGVLRLHRCPLLILDEADQLLGDVYASHMATISSHCGKRLTAQATPRPGATNGAGSDGSSSDGSNGSSDGSSSSSSKPQEQQLSSRQTVLVSATLWAGGLARFGPWCPGGALEFVTMGAGPTWSDDDGDGRSSSSSSSADPSKAWGWGAKGWEGPASVVANPKTQGSVGGPEGQQGLVPTLPPNLRHVFIIVNPDRKGDVLRRAVHALSLNMGLAFMNWQQRLKDMEAKVAARKIEVGTLHGELQPSERAVVLDAARAGAFQLLLASDVAARGLDLPQIDAVFNLELPSSASHYAHRAGRTGRMGAPGLVVSFAAPGERFVVQRLSRKLGVPILECHIAGGELVVGPPPPRKDARKKQPEADEASGDGDAAVAAGDSSSSTSKAAAAAAGSKKAPAPPPAAAAAAVDAGDGDGLTTDLAAAMIAPGGEDKQQKAALPAAAALNSSPASRAVPAAASGFSSSNMSAPAEAGAYLLDAEDELDVEGDEPLEAYKARLRAEAEAELAEIAAERRLQGAAAAAAAAGRQVWQRTAQRSGRPRGSPQEAAAMAMAAIEADAAARGRSKLPRELLGAAAAGGGGGGGGGGGDGSSSPSSGGRKSSGGRGRGRGGQGRAASRSP